MDENVAAVRAIIALYPLEVQVRIEVVAEVLRDLLAEDESPAQEVMLAFSLVMAEVAA